MANRHALLIGVPVYDDAEFNKSLLADAVRSDIAAMRAALDQSGYVITDCPTPEESGGATPSRVRKAIQAACANVPAGGVLLIYFSGHGVAIDGRDYLVLSDSYRLNGNAASTGPAAPLAVSSLVSAVPEADVLAACRARLVVFFVDACRNQSAEDEPDADGLGADSVVEPGGQQPYLAGDGGQFVLMMGCGAGQICQYDDTGSAFTQSLAKVLNPRDSARTLSEVTKAVTADMERRSRRTQGAAQVPVVRNPKVLTLVGDIELCEGDELSDAWRKAVGASPLLEFCPAPDQVHEVVAECARRCRDATEELYRRTAEERKGIGVVDPWTDQDYPGRVLRNVERLLHNAGLLANGPNSPEAVAPEITSSRSAPGPQLRPGEAALLIAGPFLREAVLAVGIRDAAAINPANLDRSYEPGARDDLELTHEMHQHLVRRAVGLSERDADGPASNRVAASDGLAMWLVHQWLASRGTLWDEPGAAEVYRLARRLIEGCWGSAGKVEVPQLLQALLQAVGAQPADRRLLGRLNDSYVDDGWRTVAAVLWLAGIMAADPRRLPPVVPDLVGTGMELPLTDVRDAANQPTAWVCRDDFTVDLRLVCEHPALHDAFQDIVARADTAAKTISSGLHLPPARADLLPRGFTESLRASKKQDGKDAYDVPLSRFQIAEEKVRELLMGRQLYGDRELAIRELYQNALDACRWRAFRQEYLTRNGLETARWEGLITFTQGTEDGRPYIQCEDNGVGMDLNTLKHVFANAGERFVYGQEFRAEQAAWAELRPPLTMVSNSQFGVGVFSYFMLADEIAVVTHHQTREGVVDGKAHEVRIASSGSLFQISAAPGRLPNGGTRVRLYLSGDATDVSVLAALRKFLWIAEHRVEVSAPDGSEAWEPGELRYESGTVKPLKCGRDLWWVPGVGGLAADGIQTNRRFRGLVVNLRDDRRPQFTVDRKTLRAWNEDWVAAQVDDALPDLMEWPGFTLSWLWDMASGDLESGDITRAQQVFDHASAADKLVAVTTPGAVASRLPLKDVGCVPTDQYMLRSYDTARGGPRLGAWRGGVWQHLGHSPRSLPSGGFAFEWSLATPLPERVAGFPIPGPEEGALLNAWAKYQTRDEMSSLDMLASFAQVGCTGRSGLRRWRKYAITGLDLSAARGIAPIDVAVTDDNIELLLALTPWPLTQETPRHELVGAMVLAALALRESPADVVHRAASVVDQSTDQNEGTDLAKRVDDAVAEASRILSFLHDAVSDGDTLRELLGSTDSPGLLSGAIGPTQLAEAGARLDLAFTKVFEVCDAMAPMGVTIPARDAYPQELSEIELLALKRVALPGQSLHPLSLLLIAAEARVSVGGAHDALARLEERGLLVRPDLNGLGDHLPTEQEVALLPDKSGQALAYRQATSPALGNMWLWVAAIITLQRGADAGLVTQARSLISLAAPNRPLTHAELAEAAWRLETTLAGAVTALSAVYPDVELPSLPTECSHLNVPWVLHSALVARSESISWGLQPAEIVATALYAGSPLGDFLATLDPFRKLGAPVPAYDETIREALNQVRLDEYDEAMLNEPDDDKVTATRDSRRVTALRLVQVAGRFGWTMAEAHQRFARLVPIGLELDYPQVELPDEIVRWEDLLVLTTFFDGQPPVISGTVDRAYLERAAEEIFDAPPEEIPARADWLRERLTIYAPLFSLAFDSPMEVVVD